MHSVLSYGAAPPPPPLHPSTPPPLPSQTADGSELRLAARQHKFAHAQAAALRHLLPLLPELLPASSEVASTEQAFAWLASAHNLSAALEEVG